jgi:hypothetical protein
MCVSVFNCHVGINEPLRSAALGFSPNRLRSANQRHIRDENRRLFDLLKDGGGKVGAARHALAIMIEVESFPCLAFVRTAIQSKTRDVARPP